MNFESPPEHSQHILNWLCQCNWILLSPDVSWISVTSEVISIGQFVLQVSSICKFFWENNEVLTILKLEWCISYLFLLRDDLLKVSAQPLDLPHPEQISLNCDTRKHTWDELFPLWAPSYFPFQTRKLCALASFDSYAFPVRYICMAWSHAFECLKYSRVFLWKTARWGGEIVPSNGLKHIQDSSSWP